MERHGIDLDSQALRAVCTKWKIHSLSVFGSILRDDFRPDSDVDLLVDYEDDAEWDLLDSVHMAEELAVALGRPVDVVDRWAIEHDGNQFIRREVLATAETVYASR